MHDDQAAGGVERNDVRNFESFEERMRESKESNRINQ